MKYNLPTLMALCQDTSVHCKWTAQARHCRLSRPSRNKKPFLSENPRNRPTKQSARSSRPSKNSTSKSKSQFRATPANKKISDHSFSVNDAGFVQFLKTHTSPKHQRVTAGGKIVPMEPPRPPRLEGSTPAMGDAINAFESPQGQIITDGQVMIMNNGRTTGSQENMRLVQTSTGDSTGEPLSSPFLKNGFLRQTEMGSLNHSGQRNVEREPSFIAYLEDPNEGYPDDSGRWEFPEWEELDPSMSGNRWARWHSIDGAISHDEVAIANMWCQVQHLDRFPDLDFYTRFARCVWDYGLDAVEHGYRWLSNKCRNHERYLVEVNEVIAMDVRSGLDSCFYALRIYNTNQRARLLAAIEILDVLIQQRHQARFRPMANRGYDGCSDEMPAMFIEPTGSNRGVDIIDPNTGRPIVIQVPQASADGTNENGHKSGGGDVRETEAEVSNKLLTFDGANEISGNVPEGSKLLCPGNAGTRSTRQNSQHAPGDVTPESDGSGNISWVHQEIWTESLPSQTGNRVSETVPRNFGASPHRYRLALPSFSEFDQDKCALEEASTTGTAGSPSPPLSPVVSVNGDEYDDHAEEEGLQNEQRNEANEANGESGLNSQSPLFDPRQPLVPSDLFDMFVITMDDTRETNGSNMSAEGSAQDSSRPNMDSRVSLTERLTEGSVAMFVRNGNGSANDSPNSGSDESVPLLSNLNPPFRWDASAHPAIHRSNASLQSGEMLSSTGSRMISTTLTARRRRQSARERADAIMDRALNSPSRLIFDLRDEVPVSTAFGFNEPDRMTTPDLERDMRVIAWLMNTHERHTAPALVNTSRINAYAYRR